MTKQEQFNKAYLGVLAQGGPSVANGLCVYRGPVGKCNVGHLFPDEVYDTAFEVLSLREVFNNPALKPYLGDDIEFLCNLQGTHDRAAIECADYGRPFLAIYKANMAILARTYRLEVPKTSDGLYDSEFPNENK